MLVLKTKNKSYSFKVTFSKANKFSMEHCKEDESLLSAVPSKIMAKDSFDFLIKMLCAFQEVGEGKKLSYDGMSEFLDEYFEESKQCFIDIYSSILKEFDYSGVFKDGMGFSMARNINQTLETMSSALTTETEITEN